MLLDAISELKAEVERSDLESLMTATECTSFLKHLGDLAHQESATNEFALSVAAGTFSLGEGLLDALRGAEVSVQKGFGKVLMLHELFHEHQGVRSTNYFEVGRAGVVLESVDFAADVFAMRVLTRSAFRRDPPSSPADVRSVTTAWIDVVTSGAQAFDQLEQGPRIQRLADRRLRRYLTWHLQRVRAETVDTPADVETLFGPVVTAELAPVSARIDRRFDRQVVAATADTELFAAVGGRLIRHSKRAGFNPAELVEAVRGFNQNAIQKAMRFVLDANMALLIPWRT